jgi:hypothetical protein
MRDKFNTTGKSPKVCLAPREKYSAFAVGQISASTAAVSRPHEGRIAIVTTRWARDAMAALASGAFYAPDENAEADGQVVGS